MWEWQPVLAINANVVSLWSASSGCDGLHGAQMHATQASTLQAAAQGLACCVVVVQGQVKRYTIAHSKKL